MDLQQLYNSPVQKVLLKNGYLYPKLITHVEIYFYWDALIVRGENRLEAVLCTSDKFKMHETTIYRIIKKIGELKKELDEISSNNSRPKRPFAIPA